MLMGGVGTTQTNTQTGRSVDQLFASLKNDQIAKEKTTMTAYDDARGREYMASIGYDVDEFERDMRNLRTHDRLL
jgi:hypothetical protein